MNLFRVTETIWASLICFMLISESNAQELPRANPQTVGISAERLKRVDGVIQKFIDDRQLAGAVTIIARHGKVVHFSAQGMQDIAAKKPMAKDTIFRIYSMTKAVVSVAAMVLVEDGKLELDAPASKYLPALGRMKVGDDKQQRVMTLRDLLRHTSGLPNNVTTDRALRKAGHPSLAESTLEEMMNRLDSVPLIYQPGKGWHYSFAADVVARLVEIGSGKTIDKALDELVFQPLHMVDTAFYVPQEKWHRFAVPYGNGLKPVAAPQPGTTGPFTFKDPPKFLSGGGGLVSTATDYMRFCLMLTGNGELNGKRLLQKATVEMMTRNQLPKAVGEISRKPAGRGFGLGFAVRIRKTDASPLGEYEWLGGLGTEFFISPNDNLAVITLSNQSPMRQIKAAVKPFVYAAIEKDTTTPEDQVNRRERYLLLDSRIVESKINARLTPGTVTKHAENPLFVEDQPWEPRYDNMYPNVIFDADEKTFKCWYSPFIVDERTSKTKPEQRHPKSTSYMNQKPNRREEALLYATSKDGIHWEKPSLKIVEFQGSNKNNIVCRGLGGCGVIKDRRDPNPARRYKAFYCTNSGYKMRYSPDGLRWGDEVALPGIGQSDTHANMIWAPERKRYIGILRHYDPLPITGNRMIARTESKDAVSWSESKTILRGTPLKQLHDMVIFRDGGLYLGLLGCMNYPTNKSRDGVRQHIELAWSPDSIHWHRVSPGTPLIGHTPARTKKFGVMPYDWGGLFPAAPVFLKDEIRIYYGASDWYFFDWRKGGLALATLRRDGWAGYEPIDARRPAQITTTPVVFMGSQLRLSADISPGGSIGVTVLDRDNGLVAASESITRTASDTTIAWKNRFSPGTLRNKKLRLRFHVTNARLFSFSFAAGRTMTRLDDE